MERTLGINPDSPGIIGLFESPSAGKLQDTVKKTVQPEMRCPKRSIRRTTMMASQLNLSLRQFSLMPVPTIRIQPPRYFPYIQLLVG